MYNLYLHDQYVTSTYALDASDVFCAIPVVIGLAVLFLTEFVNKMQTTLTQACPIVTLGGWILVAAIAVQGLTLFMLIRYRSRRGTNPPVSMNDKAQAQLTEINIIRLLMIATLLFLLAAVMYIFFTPGTTSHWVTPSTCMLTEQWFTLGFIAYAALLNMATYYFARVLHNSARILYAAETRQKFEGVGIDDGESGVVPGYKPEEQRLIPGAATPPASLPPPQTAPNPPESKLFS